MNCLLIGTDNGRKCSEYRVHIRGKTISRCYFLTKKCVCTIEHWKKNTATVLNFTESWQLRYWNSLKTDSYGIEPHWKLTATVLNFTESWQLRYWTSLKLTATVLNLTESWQLQYWTSMKADSYSNFTENWQLRSWTSLKADSYGIGRHWKLTAPVLNFTERWQLRYWTSHTCRLYRLCKLFKLFRCLIMRRGIRWIG